MSDCCTLGGKNNESYDLAVIGAGSAGFSAAITAAVQSARVALIGHGMIGGTCVNIGCVPSKTMIRAAEALHGAKVAGRFPGLTGEARITDWHALVQAKDDLVGALRQKKYVDLLPSYNGIAYLEGAARLEDGGVTVNGDAIRAGKIIITTGARPSVAPIPGIDKVDYLTSTSALDLEELPRSLIIVGGGFIGCELGQMLARAGTQVTIVCRSRLLPQVEPEVSDALMNVFREEGVAVNCGVAYEFCRQDEEGVTLCVKEGGVLTELKAERVLVATGRAPNVEGLGLEAAGIRQAVGGGIAVDDRMRTTKRGTYAAGDVTGRDEFVYMAAYGAKIAALNALNGDSLVYDNSVMPAVVFTDPQVASVGLTEAQAKAQGFETKTSLVPLNQVPRALAARDTRGLIKLVADAKTDRLLGGQILAPEGADSIQTLALAIKHGMTTKALGDTIFPYLTTVEGLKLAAQTFEKDIAKLSCCAG
ncbi:mercuric reductase [Iodidimonas nitroreducens]|uniref:Mercuric reductase n=1 Tax=Iodidimonas nitroreducens TaxID=1236968 RepID=A0A5A7NCC7_9PROT|nr:mercury(II) reductase [Iodidimonas nitroreducens]PKP78090.1 MAG: mercury(II) reductase [Alphaproteobacteria bacterium HGW-Alphaproteobacteria-3]GAK33915.1 mercuric reductase [alpha proteobacterium Q-1]GER05587.1 mercuric reductase [Iodidimonas nitroreducens]